MIKQTDHKDRMTKSIMLFIIIIATL